MNGPICIGSVLWDIIGKTERTMKQGHDVPGRITRIPGGVAYNIAQELVRLGRRPIVLTSVGQDSDGAALLSHCTDLGMQMQHVHVDRNLRTDSYMAIEDANGLVAAIADAHSLEQAGDLILQPLFDGRLGSAQHPYHGMVVIDGNLTADLLAHITTLPQFAQADVRVVPASPGKADRLQPFFTMPNAAFYVNRYEAEILCQQKFATAQDGAMGLIDQGAARAIVTDGAATVCDAVSGQPCINAPVPQVDHVARVTGAGDTFLAAHMQAELTGHDRTQALTHAAAAASAYVSGKDTYEF